LKLTILAALTFVNQHDPDLPERKDRRVQRE
jgi:hypothetical protein